MGQKNFAYTVTGEPHELETAYKRINAALENCMETPTIMNKCVWLVKDVQDITSWFKICTAMYNGVPLKLLRDHMINGDLPTPVLYVDISFLKSEKEPEIFQNFRSQYDIRRLEEDFRMIKTDDKFINH